MSLRASACVSLLVIVLCFVVTAAVPPLAEVTPYLARLTGPPQFDFAAEARRRGDDAGAWLAAMKYQYQLGPGEHVPALDRAYGRAAALMPQSAAPQVLRGVTGVPLRRAELPLSYSSKAPTTRPEAVQPLTPTERQHLLQARARLSLASTLDPTNAAVDYYLAYLALAEHDDETAFRLLATASGKQRWSLYARETMSAALRVANEELGRNMGAVEAGQYYDHCGFDLTFLARNVAAIADESRARGDHETAIALSQSVIHMGQLMTERSSTLAEALQGQIAFSVGAYLPPGRGSPQATTEADYSRAAERERMLSYLAAHSRGDLAQQLDSFGRRADRMMERVEDHIASQKAETRRLGRISSGQEASYAGWGLSLILVPLAALIALLTRLAGRTPVAPVWSRRRWIVILLAFVVAGASVAASHVEALVLAPVLMLLIVPLGLALQRWRRRSAEGVGFWRQLTGVLLAVVFPMAAALSLVALGSGAQVVAQVRAHTREIESTIDQGEIAYYRLLPR